MTARICEDSYPADLRSSRGDTSAGELVSNFSTSIATISSGEESSTSKGWHPEAYWCDVQGCIQLSIQLHMPYSHSAVLHGAQLRYQAWQWSTRALKSYL
jgi:hypothetical protein